MCARRLWSMSLCALQCLVVCAFVAFAPATSRAAPPTNADAINALVADTQTLVANLAQQRDAIGGWPSNIQDAYNTLTQLQMQLQSAKSTGDVATARARYQSFIHIAARISRWLVNNLAPTNDQVPTRDKVDAAIARLQERVDLLTKLANQAGKTLDLTAVNQARSQVQTARSSGTDAQLLAALRALRAAIDSLQDTLAS